MADPAAHRARGARAQAPCRRTAHPLPRIETRDPRPAPFCLFASAFPAPCARGGTLSHDSRVVSPTRDPVLTPRQA
eukprot:7382992-Prymnesium_polylepis.1